MNYKSTSVPSGFAKLDEKTGGWRPGDFAIIAGRPSMGKTAFALSMARNMAIDHDCGVAYFSAEMSERSLMARMFHAETEFDVQQIIHANKPAWEQLNSKMAKLIDAPLYIDDTPAPSVSEIREKCQQLIVKNDIKVAIIDYLQLMTWMGDEKLSREQEELNITRTLKAIAVELNIAVIALGQLNRCVNNWKDRCKRPILSDLPSEGIAQNADMVILIHRPEYYGIYEDSEGNELSGVAEIIISKNRNDILGDVRLTFDNKFYKFVDSEITGAENV